MDVRRDVAPGRGLGRPGPSLAMSGIAALMAIHAATAAVAAGEDTALVGYTEARDMTRSYSEAISGAPLVIARTGEWPDRNFPGLRLSVTRRGVIQGRVTYDVTAQVENASICEGAISGGRAGTATIQVGDVVYPPPAFTPYRSGKSTTDPSVEICGGVRFPNRVRFTHIQAVGDAAEAR